MRIAIAGAGIGGLSAALALHARGLEVEVFEQAAEIRPLGVGINVLPHAVAVLARLGLEPQLAATGIATREYVFANRWGQQIFADQRGLAAGYDEAQYSVHRGELQMLLYDAALQRLGAARLHTGRRLAAFAERAADVELRFADGAVAHAGVLVGADGIHSSVRRQLYPDEGPPRWNGITMWRGVTVGKPFLTGASVVLAGWHEQKFVCYPISRPHAERGEALINWIADLRQEGGMLPPEDWNRRGRLEDFLPRFAGWRFPFLDVAETIRNAQGVYEFPMVDRDPLPRWSFGRVTLLGDAAHPMTPHGSNGAGQAILDAAALAEALAGTAPPDEALAAYEAKRRPAAEAVVLSNRNRGFDVVLDIVHERAPTGFARLEEVVRPGEIAEIVAHYKRATGHHQNKMS